MGYIPSLFQKKSKEVIKLDIFDDIKFLGFVKQVLEEKIQKQEALIDVERANFFDKQLDYELSKELHTYQKWLNDVNSYIINKTVFGGGNIR